MGNIIAEVSSCESSRLHQDKIMYSKYYYVGFARNALMRERYYIEHFIRLFAALRIHVGYQLYIISYYYYKLHLAGSLERNPSSKDMIERKLQDLFQISEINNRDKHGHDITTKYKIMTRSRCM